MKPSRIYAKAAQRLEQDGILALCFMAAITEAEGK